MQNNSVSYTLDPQLTPVKTILHKPVKLIVLLLELLAQTPAHCESQQYSSSFKIGLQTAIR